MAGGDAIPETAPEGRPLVASHVGREARRGEREAPASQSLSDGPRSAAGSPRLDAASIRALARAVVYVRPSKRATTEADRATAATREGETTRSQARSNRGFIVDGQGYIVTNDQVVGEATSFEVTLHDGRRLPAALLARDRLNGIAVLKVEGSGLPTIALGDSRALSVGERVLLIGTKDGLERAPTAATVRATGAATGGNLALDPALSPEGSGSPLLNRLGQAVGIMVPGGEPRKLTFAVPTDRVKPILRNLMARPAAGSTRNLPEAR
jgi:S1-C subfamily serine protease